MASQQSDDDSDYTEDETLVMLNFPQLNFDETKLKMLNVIRKRETADGATINENIKGEEESNKETREQEKRKKIPKIEKNTESVNPISISIINSNINEKSQNIETGDYKQKTNKGKAIKINEQKEEINEDNVMDKKEKRKREKEDNKDKCKEKNEKGEKKEEKEIEKEYEIKEFPFGIKSLCLENIFSETPKCILNNKYTLTGIQTSSIGTNLFFKEPQIVEKDSDLDNTNISYDHVFKKEMKNENIMTRGDFAIYEGHSTKIISFEIDY